MSTLWIDELLLFVFLCGTAKHISTIGNVYRTSQLYAFAKLEIQRTIATWVNTFVVIIESPKILQSLNDIVGFEPNNDMLKLVSYRYFKHIT